jgi:hypothetical protein
MTRREIVPPPALDLHGLVHGELRLGRSSVAGVAGRRDESRQLIASRSRSSGLQESL